MKKAGDILRGILPDDQAAAATRWSSFFSGWQKIVGTDIAAHSRVVEVQSGVVIVEVDHPGWLQLLQIKKSKILSDMKRRYPELGIHNIRVFVGSVKKTAPPREKTPAKEPPRESEEYLRFKEMLTRLRNTRRQSD